MIKMRDLLEGRLTEARTTFDVGERVVWKEPKITPILFDRKYLSNTNFGTGTGKINVNKDGFSGDVTGQQTAGDKSNPAPIIDKVKSGFVVKVLEKKRNNHSPWDWRYKVNAGQGLELWVSEKYLLPVGS